MSGERVLAPGGELLMRPDGRALLADSGAEPCCGEGGCPDDLSTDWIEPPAPTLCGAPGPDPPSLLWKATLGQLPANRHFLLTFEVEAALVVGATAQYGAIHDCGTIWRACVGFGAGALAILSVRRYWNYTNPCTVTTLGTGRHLSVCLLSTGPSAQPLMVGWTTTTPNLRDAHPLRVRLHSCSVYPHPPIVHTLPELQQVIGGDLAVATARTRMSGNLGLVLDFGVGQGADCWWTDHVFYANRVWPLVIVHRDVWQPGGSALLELRASNIIGNGRYPGSTNPPQPALWFVPRLVTAEIHDAVPPSSVTFPVAGIEMPPLNNPQSIPQHLYCQTFSYPDVWNRAATAPTANYTVVGIFAPALIPDDSVLGHCAQQQTSIVDARHVTP